MQPILRRARAYQYLLPAYLCAAWHNKWQPDMGIVLSASEDLLEYAESKFRDFTPQQIEAVSDYMNEERMNNSFCQTLLLPWEMREYHSSATPLTKKQFIHAKYPTISFEQAH